jgi:hypothetical protein
MFFTYFQYSLCKKYQETIENHQEKTMENCLGLFLGNYSTIVEYLAKNSVEIARNFIKRRNPQCESPSPSLRERLGFQGTQGPLDRSNWIRSKIQCPKCAKEHRIIVGIHAWDQR